MDPSGSFDPVGGKESGRKSAEFSHSRALRISTSISRPGPREELSLGGGRYG